MESCVILLFSSSLFLIFYRNKWRDRKIISSIKMVLMYLLNLYTIPASISFFFYFASSINQRSHRNNYTEWIIQIIDNKQSENYYLTYSCVNNREQKRHFYYFLHFTIHSGRKLLTNLIHILTISIFILTC